MQILDEYGQGSRDQYIPMWIDISSLLLRGTTLYASETYYSLSESEFFLESYDESLLIKMTKTLLYCPRVVLYLDFGLWPARFRIEEYKLNFLHYIRSENENSLLYRFFDAQLIYPVRGGWVFQVQSIFKVLKIEETFDQIKYIKNLKFQKNCQIKNWNKLKREHMHIWYRKLNRKEKV